MANSTGKDSNQQKDTRQASSAAGSDGGVENLPDIEAAATQRDDTGNRQSASPGDAGRANQQQPYNQGGHEGMGGHGGQQSGGMGGQHGGPLHDVGSAQSGMTGGSGMGGNDSPGRQGGGQEPRQDDKLGSQQQGGNRGESQGAEVQQSAQREGMGNHRHTNRDSENDAEATRDVDDVGSRRPAAARDSDDKNA